MPEPPGPPGIAIFISKKMKEGEEDEAAEKEAKVGADMAKDLWAAMEAKDWKEAGKMFVAFVDYAMRGK